ncbi:kinase-like domain-containing protein [Mycena filopes]|nr:kinase-like domain-containing protein [Mycena filopes]
MPVPLERPVLIEAQQDELRLSLREISPECIKFRLIGTTSYGKVYRVHHKTLNKIVALKIVECGTTEEGKMTTVYRSSDDGPPKDFAILKSLAHPHILQILSTYRGGTGYSMNIFAEYVPGGTLYDYVVRESETQRLQGSLVGLSELACRDIIYQISQAVAYVHRLGIVHRNLKLDNIFLSGDAPFVKVAGFGLATHVPPNGRLTEVRGSLEYTAPEMLDAAQPGYTTIADVWAVGIMLFQISDDDDDVLRLTMGCDHTYESPRTLIEYNPPTLRWDLLRGRLSDDGLDFITSLLLTDPAMRLSMEHALEFHPWLVYHRPMYPNVVYPEA